MNNGYLTALSFKTRLEEDTELVVNTGCESGLGSIKSGEGVYGLKEQLLLLA